ncbi:MAG: acyl-CoA/acyl-ACP dehydrogenase, partial [Gloeomargaritaceae cyanobacterium C42_A2020_066]|nr:acyl-CoA/acyl-ACP dehydrogenase [Gloeomargaritaceae cyanobacterium C42_A2020_066]
ETALQALGNRRLLAFNLPQPWGDAGRPDWVVALFQAQLARVSGALAFLHTQHQSAAVLLARGDNVQLKKEYLLPMTTGEKRLGVGFSHLRHPGPAVITARPAGADWVVSGTVPWVTGWGFFPQFILGARLPDDQVLLGLVPLMDQDGSQGRIACSPPLALAAMASTQTVQVTLQDWRLAADQVVAIRPADWLHHQDQSGRVRGAFAPLGCAQGALDCGMAAATDATQPYWHSLEQEWQACRHALLVALQTGETATAQTVPLRAWAIDLSLRCSQAAVLTSGGRMHLPGQAAQRLYREALVYAVSGQTPEIRDACLARVVRPAASPPL